MPKSFLENREIVHQLDYFAAWTLLPKKWGQNEKKSLEICNSLQKEMKNF